MSRNFNQSILAVHVPIRDHFFKKCMKDMRMRKWSTGTLLVAVMCLLLLVADLKAQAPKGRQPNVIIILVDDMGYSDIGCFGGDFTPTPNIDALAKSGMKLESYYSAAPICSPSRAGMLTGHYPGRWNFCTFLDTKTHNKKAEQTDFLATSAPSMARFFKQSGYATGHFGKWHLGGGRDVRDAPPFSEYGFDEHASTYESPQSDPLLTATNWIWSDKDSIKRWDRTQYFVDKTLEFLSKNKSKPCFINLWPDDVHTPWVPKAGDDDLSVYPKNREGEAAFRLVLKELDIQIGRLMQGLKKLDIERNTIVVFTSDNGPMPSFRGSRAAGLRGSKLSLYEGGIRMPFIISWPGHVPSERTDKTSVVSALDLLPSLGYLCGIKIPAGYKGDGINRAPVFTGKPSPRNTDIFWEYGRNNIAYNYPKEKDRSPSLAIRSGKWKFLMNSDGSNQQLYNLIEDPKETENRISGNEKMAQTLKGRLDTWWSQLPRLKTEVN